MLLTLHPSDNRDLSSDKPTLCATGAHLFRFEYTQLWLYLNNPKLRCRMESLILHKYDLPMTTI